MYRSAVFTTQDGSAVSASLAHVIHARTFMLWCQLGSTLFYVVMCLLCSCVVLLSAVFMS